MYGFGPRVFVGQEAPPPPSPTELALLLAALQRALAGPNFNAQESAMPTNISGVPSYGSGPPNIGGVPQYGAGPPNIGALPGYGPSCDPPNIGQMPFGAGLGAVPAGFHGGGGNPNWAVHGGWRGQFPRPGSPWGWGWGRPVVYAQPAVYNPPPAGMVPCSPGSPFPCYMRLSNGQYLIRNW